jgi:hydrogenase maturation factor HypF (carbamoyltransferase family)
MLLYPIVHHSIKNFGRTCHRSILPFTGSRSKLREIPTEAIAKYLPLVSIMMQMNPLHILSFYFFKVHYYITSPSRPNLLSVSVLQVFLSVL